jgi:proline iminopeptidase
MSSALIVRDGLAVYDVGTGEPTLVLPYPHASTLRPMGEDHLTELLVGMGRRVITFDPPGAYRSTRPMHGDLAEMLACAEEALDVAGIAAPVDVVGHSMGALCSLALAVEQPQVVHRLVLVAGCSGFPAVRRWSTPHNWRWWADPEWWLLTWWGTRQILGMGSLAVHKRLDNLIEVASYVDQRHVELWTVEPGDSRRPAPPRAQWLRHVRRVDYAPRLSEVRAPTLLVVGRHDPQTPVACARELKAGIAGSTLVIFDHSGHTPFVEEPQLFVDVVGRFLSSSG